MKVRDYLNELKEKLERNEAEQILCAVLEKDRSYFFAHALDEIPEEVRQKAGELAARRVSGEPLQYILGSAEFMGLEYYVDRRVLIPRPETELLCEEAKRALVLSKAPCDPDKCRFCFNKESCGSAETIGFAANVSAASANGPAGDAEISSGAVNPDTDAIRVLDLCTGSGAIAVYIAHEFKDASVVASDISEDALAVAKINAEKNSLRILNGFADNDNLEMYSSAVVPLGPEVFDGQGPEELSGNIKFVQSDLFENINGKFKLITANPPYIPSKVVEELDPVVRDHEPHLALDGGEDGFELPLRIIKEAPSYLDDDGILLMEIGDDQGARALEAAANCGFRSCRIIKDYAGQARILFASL